MHYSPGRNAFYDSEIIKPPADALEISRAQHDSLMAAQQAGKKISPGADGLPCAVDPYDRLADGKWVKDAAAELADSKVSAVAKVIAHASSIRQQIAGDADHYETAGWADKARRAERVVADQPLAGDLDILTAETQRRGKSETPEALALIQLAKAGRFAMAVSVIDGLTAKAKAAIDAAKTVAEIDPLLTQLKADADAELAALLAG